MDSSTGARSVDGDGPRTWWASFFGSRGLYEPTAWILIAAWAATTLAVVVAGPWSQDDAMVAAQLAVVASYVYLLAGPAELPLRALFAWPAGPVQVRPRKWLLGSTGALFLALTALGPHTLAAAGAVFSVLYASLLSLQVLITVEQLRRLPAPARRDNKELRRFVEPMRRQMP